MNMNDINSLIPVALGIIVAIGVVLLVGLGLIRGRVKPLNTAYYRQRIEEIERLIADKPGDKHALESAVMNADKLLDHALREKRISGNTMGERLKKASKQLRDPNAVWAAHRLRNRIAHEDNVNVAPKAAMGAVKVLKKALHDVGAL